MLDLYLAWRNLWRHARRTWLTALAMIFSNVLLVFLISLQFGSYQMMINNTLQVFSGHIQIQQQDYNDKMGIRNSVPDVVALAGQVQKRLPAAQVAARGAAFALASSDERSLGVQVVGVQPEQEPGVSTLPGLIVSGRYLKDTDAAEIVIGKVLASNLKVDLGDELTLLGGGRDGSFAAGVVVVVGIFESGSREIDRGLTEIPLGYFQQTFSMGDAGHAVVITLPALDQVEQALPLVSQAIDDQPGLVVMDWDRLQPGLKQAIQADLSSAWFMYGVLIILVAFSVLNTQLMSVLERTREYGVITALGVKPTRLASLVMLETLLMALLGLGIGLLLGWAVAGYLGQAGFSYPGMEEMAGKFNIPERIYPEVSWFSILLGPSVVFLFSLLAAVYPSLRLLKLQPVAAMRAP